MFCVQVDTSGPIRDTILRNHYNPEHKHVILKLRVHQAKQPSTSDFVKDIKFKLNDEQISRASELQAQLNHENAMAALVKSDKKNKVDV